jgi:ComEC/Rec2-related protein
MLFLSSILKLDFFRDSLAAQFVGPRIHALLYITLAFMAGITGQFLGLPTQALIIITTIGSLSSLIYKEYSGFWRPLLFLISVSFATGALLCRIQTQSQKDFLSDIAGQPTSVRGTIASIERIQNPRFRYRIVIDLSNNSIALYVRTMPPLLVGDSIEINNITFKQIANQSFAHYLAKEKIAATVFLDTLEYTLLQRPRFNLNRTIFYFRQHIFDELRNKINRETFQLFSSIFLGNRAAVKKQMDATKEPFKVWGTSHYLARSGLHLVIFVIIWHFILSLLPIAFIIKQLILIMLILLYALLSWSSVSFERALLMFLVYKFCLLHGRPLHYVHLVILATFLVLLVNPLQLFFLDFQLSFGLTFALAWFNHIETHKRRALL